MARAMFADRDDAGRRLGAALGARPWARGASHPLVLAIPRGGVPVAYHAARALGAELDLVVPRKIQIPWEPEAGFGAVTSDGTVTLNEPLVARLGLAPGEVESLAAGTVAEVRRREAAFRGGAPPPDVRGRAVVVVDDGIASGFTMIAALRSLRARGAGTLAVGAPCAPADSVDRVGPHADDVVVLEVDRGWSFAVASHYERWWDLDDEEVHGYLRRAREEGLFRPDAAAPPPPPDSPRNH
jgi:putative phosphoribosyl transferase